MFDLIDGLKNRVFGETKPDGTPEFPAKSCKDIQMCFPEATSGEYWLDPNGGQSDDKVKVVCNFTADRVETCVQPAAQFDIVTMAEFKSNDFTQHKWVAKENAQILYPVLNSQWRHMIMGMRSGHQNITYHCKNSPAHKTMEGSQDDFLKLLNNKNVELQTDTRSWKEQVEVVEDSCWMNDGTWQQTVIDYTTTDLKKLPLRDVAVRGSGNADESFSLTLGSVCFSS